MLGGWAQRAAAAPCERCAPQGECTAAVGESDEACGCSVRIKDDTSICRPAASCASPEATACGEGPQPLFADLLPLAIDVSPRGFDRLLELVDNECGLALWGAADIDYDAGGAVRRVRLSAGETSGTFGNRHIPGDAHRFRVDVQDLGGDVCAVKVVVADADGRVRKSLAGELRRGGLSGELRLEPVEPVEPGAGAPRPVSWNLAPQ